MYTVYSQVNCMPCKMTKRFLDEHNIKYKEFSISDPKYLEEAKATGFTQLPIVVAPDGTVIASGFSPDKLKLISL